MAASSESKDSFGGIKIRNFNEIDINLLCELCKLLQLHPMQLLCCGTRLCRWCSKNGVPDSVPFICPFCQTKQAKKQAQADRGIERELNMTKVDCYSCSWNGLFKEYQKHLQQHHAELECSDCHARFFAINSYEEHRQEICEYRCIPCGLPDCIELIKWSEMKTHYLSTKHQKQLVKFIIEYIFGNKRLSYGSNRSTTIPNVVNNRTRELTVIEESFIILSPGLETLSSDSTRLTFEYNQTKTNCEGMISQINEAKKVFNEDNEKLLKCVQSQNETEKELDVTKKLYTSSIILLLDADATLFFSFRIHTEDVNSLFSMYSPIFKTSPYGYSFILRVCSTIDSTNKNQGYLSIYITLLRSDFDRILFYPFPYNISLYLYDQSGQGKHIESTIKPDPNSSSFACPTSEKNNEVGITEFCPLNYLTDVPNVYLKDGVFFIRIFFDFMHTGSNLS